MSEISKNSEPPEDFEKLLAAADPQDFDEIPPTLRPLMMRMMGKVALRITEEFSGPLPPPEQLAKYNQVLPGAADRIVAMAERQSAHRIELEKIVVPSQLRESGEGRLKDGES